MSAMSWQQAASGAAATLAVATRNGSAMLADSEIYLLACLLNEQMSRRASLHTANSEVILHAVSVADELPALVEEALAEASMIEREADHRQKRCAFLRKVEGLHA